MYIYTSYLFSGLGLYFYYFYVFQIQNKDLVISLYQIIRHLECENYLGYYTNIIQSWEFKMKH